MTGVEQHLGQVRLGSLPVKVEPQQEKLKVSGGFFTSPEGEFCVLHLGQRLESSPK
jgi:hypothetical protein